MNVRRRHAEQLRIVRQRQRRLRQAGAARRMRIVDVHRHRHDAAGRRLQVRRDAQGRIHARRHDRQAVGGDGISGAVVKPAMKRTHERTASTGFDAAAAAGVADDRRIQRLVSREPGVGRCR